MRVTYATMNLSLPIMSLYFAKIRELFRKEISISTRPMKRITIRSVNPEQFRNTCLEYSYSLGVSYSLINLIDRQTAPILFLKIQLAHSVKFFRNFSSFWQKLFSNFSYLDLVANKAASSFLKLYTYV